MAVEEEAMRVTQVVLQDSVDRLGMGCNCHPGRGGGTGECIAKTVALQHTDSLKV